MTTQPGPFMADDLDSEFGETLEEDDFIDEEDDAFDEDEEFEWVWVHKLANHHHFRRLSLAQLVGEWPDLANIEKPEFRMPIRDKVMC